MKRVLGLIPARGGSQRIARKNLAQVGGHSLLEMTIRQALDSKVLDEVMVSSEDSEIQDASLLWGAQYLNRPSRLAEHDTPTMPVILHALQFIPCDTLVLLQPTSPLRTAEDIRQALAIFDSTKADAVISVTEAPENLVFSLGHAGRLRPAPRAMVENGAIYIADAAALLRGEGFYSGIVHAYPMPKDRSLDIDTPQDLEIARLLIGKGERAVA